MTDRLARCVFTTPVVRSQHARAGSPFEEGCREALQYAEDSGWIVIAGGSHRWGIVWCPAHVHFVNIHSTPANEGNHAKSIRRAVDRCDHRKEGEEE